MINIKNFGKLDLRIGTIIEAETLEKAKKPAYLLEIDFGDLGIKKSSAQITDLYQPDDLVGRQIVAVINLSPKKIAGITSEVLVLGANSKDKAVVLLEPQNKIPNGSKIS
ncbi:MAG: tRNA-binding protein [Candidatus Neomarinimicrobiota bacterium]